MIKTLKDMKHGKSQYESQTSERTASQILHHMEGKDTEDYLESARARVLSNAQAIYGSTRYLDIISYSPTSSRKIGAAIVEHQPTSRPYTHCSSAKEDSRLGAVEHLLVITEDILQRLLDKEGITSSGWLPATAQAQHAAAFNASSVGGSVPRSLVPSVTGSAMPSLAGSLPSSRRSSMQPVEFSNRSSPRKRGHADFSETSLTPQQQRRQYTSSNTTDDVSHTTDQ